MYKISSKVKTKKVFAPTEITLTITIEDYGSLVNLREEINQGLLRETALHDYVYSKELKSLLEALSNEISKL